MSVFSVGGVLPSLSADDGVGKGSIGMAGSLAFNAFVGSQSNRETINLSRGATLLVKQGVSKYETGGPLFSLDNSSIKFYTEGEMDVATFYQWMFTMSLSGDRSTKLRYIVPQVYLEMSSKYAILDLGNYSGVEDTMSLGAAKVLGGTGGFGSSAHRAFVVMTTGCYNKVELIGDPDDATKISITTPRVWGVSLGVSFTPDTAKVGRRNRSDLGPLEDKELFYNRQFWAFGLNYVDFLTSEAKLSLSVTGVTGRPATTQTTPRGEDLYFHPTNGVMVGGVLALSKVSLGAEIGWMDRTAALKGNYPVSPPSLKAEFYEGDQARAPIFWDVGMSVLLTDSTKLAFGYYYSTRKTGFALGGTPSKAITHIGNASLTYEFQPGAQIYLEGFYHLTKNPAALYDACLQVEYVSKIDSKGCVEDQRALTALVGMKLSF